MKPRLHADENGNEQTAVSRQQRAAAANFQLPTTNF